MKKRNSNLFAVFVLLAFLSPAHADEAEDARQEVELIVQAIQKRDHDAIQSVTDKTELGNRIYAVRAVNGEARQIFDSEFWELFDAFFWSSIPDKSVVRSIDLVQFEFSNGAGTAVVRLQFPGYRFSFFTLEVRNNRGKTRIVDMHRLDLRLSLSVEMADYLASFMPDGQSTRALLTGVELSDADVFQVAELLKAYRDNNLERFYEIYGGLDQSLQQHELLARINILLAMRSNNVERLDEFMPKYLRLYGADERYLHMLADAFIESGDWLGAYDSLLAFKTRFALQEGGTSSQLSALALANGNIDAAETHAKEAIDLEPALELAWWSLLRAQVALGDFAGALEPLTHLEDNFGHRLDEASLRRDSYRAFTGLVASDEFKDWRADRP